MRAEDLIGLIRRLGLSNGMKVIDNGKDVNVMFCCPWHGERHPSCGISAEKEVGACFACKKSFTVIELVMYVNKCTFSQACDFLEGIVNVRKQSFDRITVKYLDDGSEEYSEDESETLPIYKLAPFRSGKITHNYLLQRGFTKTECRDFKIGWDSAKNRVTIPIFGRDGSLQGFIGRAVLEPKINGIDNPEYKALYGDSPKYYIYPPLHKTKVLFPLDKFELIDDTVILVEGQLDAWRMHQYGYKNTLSTITASLSDYQISLLYDLGVKKVILMYDNDDAGKSGMDKAVKSLAGFVIYKVPLLDEYNDPCSSPKELVDRLIDSKKLALSVVCKRLI